jgi:rod shape-determining protein MreD
MNAFALFGLGLVLVIVQTTAFRLLGISFLRAPLVLSLVIYAAFHMERTRGLLLSFLLGYASDVYSGGVQGITPMVMVFLCLIGQWMRRGIIVEGKMALGVVAFAFGMMQGILWVGIGALVEGALWLVDVPYTRLLLQSLVLAVLSPVLVGLAAPIDRWALTAWRRLQGIRA